MLQLKSMIKCVDNSGAQMVECIKVLKAGRWASVGDEITVVVQKARVQGAQRSQDKVKPGDIRRAIVVRTKAPQQRRDGRTIRFDDNACVLINSKREPIGTRILSAVSMDLKHKGFDKILAIAQHAV